MQIPAMTGAGRAPLSLDMIVARLGETGTIRESSGTIASYGNPVEDITSAYQRGEREQSGENPLHVLLARVRSVRYTRPVSL